MPAKPRRETVVRIDQRCRHEPLQDHVHIAANVRRSRGKAEGHRKNDQLWNGHDKMRNEKPQNSKEIPQRVSKMDEIRDTRINRIPRAYSDVPRTFNGEREARHSNALSKP